MEGENKGRYPGELAKPQDLVRLADEYRNAARAVASLGRPREPMSRAPYRLSAIHAVELYLNALLIHAGHEPASVRNLQHDLAARTDLALGCGLTLRLRTVAHLRSLTGNREYVVSRYQPGGADSLSQLNRLAATLEEVAAKVTVVVTSRPRPPGGRPLAARA
jgi:HEPN domain-containing protein